MKIIILGAGQVGTTVAKNLAGEANDITVVDLQPLVLKNLQERLDIRTVSGQASHPEVLLSAGIEDADLILAVTNSDETNMVACQVAHTLFHTPTRLARVRSPDYIAHPELFSPDAIPVDVIISPEQLLTRFIQHLIEQPGVLQILDFLDNQAQLVAVRAHHDGPLVGRQLRDLPQNIPKAKLRIVAIYRRGQAMIPGGETKIEAADEILFMAPRSDIRTIVTGFRPSSKANHKVIIAGGGNIGKRLAELLEPKLRVKIIEHNAGRCRFLAETLHRAIILQGDAGDADLLKGEGIDDTDVYCALTNDDEANILSAMLAKRLGVRHTLSIVNRPSYVELAQGNAVDIAVSPAQVTIGALLTHIRRGDVVAVHSLHKWNAEAIEIIAHGDRETSRVVGRRIDELPLPEGASVGAIARQGELIFPHTDTIFEPEDHIVFFFADRTKITEMEKLFQVAITFI